MGILRNRGKGKKGSSTAKSPEAKASKSSGARSNRKKGEPISVRFKRAVVRTLGAICGVVLASGLLVSSVWLYSALVTSPYLEIRTIEVEGTSRLTEDEAIRLSGVRLGRNILLLDSEAAEVALTTEHFVKTASVSRKLPGKVLIEVRERVPLVLVNLGPSMDSHPQRLRVMDSGGEIFKDYVATDLLDLPVVNGLKGTAPAPAFNAALFELISAIEGSGVLTLADTSEIHSDPVYGFTVYTLGDKVRVEIGKGGFAKKLRKLKKVVAARDGSLRGIETVDLNNDRGVVLGFGNRKLKEGGMT